MWPTDPPQVTADDAAKACAAGIRDKALRDAVTAARQDFSANSIRFQAVAAIDELHTVVSGDYAVTNLSKAELTDLYSKQIARSNSPARKAIYEVLLGAAPMGRCVYCREGDPRTLDHYVPKALVPGLAIDPWNLVPACRDCNMQLGDGYSGEAQEQFLHPYFLGPLGRWLRAEVVQTTPPDLRFHADPDAGLSTEVATRIVYQFNRLKLGSRYSKRCATEVTGLGRILPSRFDGCAPCEVRDFLKEQAEIGFADDDNDRRAVMFEALAASDWYCEGGYLTPVTRPPTP